MADHAPIPDDERPVVEVEPVTTDDRPVPDDERPVPDSGADATPEVHPPSPTTSGRYTATTMSSTSADIDAVIGANGVRRPPQR